MEIKYLTIKEIIGICLMVLLIIIATPSSIMIPMMIIVGVAMFIVFNYKSNQRKAERRHIK